MSLNLPVGPVGVVWYFLKLDPGQHITAANFKRYVRSVVLPPPSPPCPRACGEERHNDIWKEQTVIILPLIFSLFFLSHSLLYLHRLSLPPAPHHLPFPQ